MSSPKLVLWSHLPSNPNRINAEDNDAIRENTERLLKSNILAKASFHCVESGNAAPFSVQHSLELLSVVAELSAPKADITIVQVVFAGVDDASNASPLPTEAQLIKTVKLAGLQVVESVQIADEDVSEAAKILHVKDRDLRLVRVSCRAPSFEVGSSKLLSFAKDTKKSAKDAVWSLDMDDNDVELVDEDDLLDDEDKAKPEPSSLRVCGTTGKRKACKDCSCGLKEELEAEEGGSKKTSIKKTVTSSCGSCYLGDAFRCASCPYLGMPAFKPGEKIQLSDRQLKADQ